MPGRDGTGPLGRGEATGRGMGTCVIPRKILGRRGMGRGMGRSVGRGSGASFRFGRGMGFCRVPLTESEEKEWLKREKEILKEELNYVEQELGSQSDKVEEK